MNTQMAISDVCVLLSDFLHWKSITISRFHPGVESEGPSSRWPTATAFIPVFLSLSAILLLSQTKLKRGLRAGDLTDLAKGFAHVLPQGFQSQQWGAAGLAWSQ